MKMLKKDRPGTPKREANRKLKVRVLEAKGKLPAFGISTFFLQKFPEYNNKKSASRLNNVLQLRVCDEEMTSKLEALADMFGSAVKA